jgi:ethanolamine utilization protein EutA
MFSRVHLRRRKHHLSSRYIVVGREMIWSSPIRFTPFLDDDTIDAPELNRFILEAYQSAGLKPDDVDTGAVILTGEAIKRKNAQAIGDLFAHDGGKFVCASAGHRLECSLAAHGSGAVELARSLERPVLNIDIGGGTTKFALCRNGRVEAVAAIAIGARLIARDEAGRLIRFEEPARIAAEIMGLDLRLGDPAPEDMLNKLADEFVRILVALVQQRPLGALGSALMLTGSLDGQVGVDITFSGGVSEYIYGREHRNLGDMALPIATRLYGALFDRSYALHDPGQGIRATAIGASQFTIQVSGRTIHLSNVDLPQHNIPVIVPDFEPAERPDVAGLTQAICEARARQDIAPESRMAVALKFPGSPHYHRLRAMAEAIVAAYSDSGDAPLVLIIDNDVGRLLGRLISEEFSLNRKMICIDGIELGEFDYIDVGAKVPTAQVVPIVVKSLLFGR